MGSCSMSINSRQRMIFWASLVSAGFVACAAGYGQEVKRGVMDNSPQPVVTLQPGPYYALVIGNNNYKYLNKLQTAVNDAKAVAQLLQDTYGFSVKPLYDATRDDILTALVEYRKNLPGQSNLLIYYAGHGHNDREADEAYWLPVDAQQDNNQNWISADDITRDVRTIPSQHILIISDSCYSGVLSRDADIAINPSERGTFLAKMWSSKSRTLMASGADEPVADGGGGGHSIFANALLQSLNSMGDSEFTAAALFQRVQPSVAGRSAQLPQYSLIRNSGHNYGDFIFSRGGRAFAAPTVAAIIEGNGDVNLGDLTGGVVKNTGESSSLPNTSHDAEAIRKLLDTYQQAYNYRDASMLWRIWPGVSARNKQSVENSFKSALSIKMSLQVGTPDIAPDGQSAIVRGQSSQAYTPRVGSALPARTDDIIFSLKRDGTTWVISGVNDQK